MADYVGTSGNDRLVATWQDDRLEGLAGDDQLEGGWGRDVLIGGAGNDTLYAGGAEDTAVYSGLFSDYAITANADGSWSVTDLRDGSPDGTDRIFDVEWLQFADRTVAPGASEPPPPVNTAPVAGADSATTGAGAALARGAAAGLLANDTDADGDALTVTAVNGQAVVGAPVTLPSGARLTVQADGGYSYDPAGAFDHLGEGQQATDSFTYTVGDGRGGTATATATITVEGADAWSGTGLDLVGTAGNDRLVASWTDDRLQGLGGDDQLEGGWGRDLLIGGGGNDTLYAGGAEDTAVYSGLFSDYSITANADGSWTVADLRPGSPDGTDRIFDVEWLQFADRTVAPGASEPPPPANTAPVAGADAATTGAGAALARGAAAGLLANDTDADGDALTVTAVNGQAVVGAPVTLPSGARLTVQADGGYSYDPAGAFDHLGEGQQATDSFTYTVGDGRGGTATATATITIEGADAWSGTGLDLVGTAGNDRLVASWTDDRLQGLGGDDQLEGGWGRDLLIGGGGNDTLYAGGAEDTAVYSGRFADYAITANGDGSWTVTDLRDRSPDGTDRIFDVEWLQFADRTVAPGATPPPNQAPVVEDIIIATNMSQWVTGTLGGSDPEDGALHWRIVTGPAEGTLNLNPDGSYTYAPLGGYSGADSFVFEVVDAAGAATRATATITVAPPPGRFDMDYIENTSEHTPGSLGFYGRPTPAVAALAGGGHVVVWSDFDNYGIAGDRYTSNIFVQRYDAAGEPVGRLRELLTAPGYSQSGPSVAGLSGGGYVVVWTDSSRDWNGNGQDGSASGVFGRLFTADGLSVGAEFQVNVTTDGYQGSPAVTALGSGFVVTWNGPDAADGTNNLHARLFDSSGGPVTGEIAIDAVSAGAQSASSIARAGDGFVVVWAEDSDPDWYDDAVYAQRFGADGLPLGAPTQVSDPAAGRTERPSVASLSDGGYVILWDSPGSGLYMRRYEADGDAVGGETLVTPEVSIHGTDATVSALADGGWVALWQGVGADASGDILGQRFDAAGNRVGGEFVVNAARGFSESQPTATLRADGALAVAWTANDGEIFTKVIDDFTADTHPPVAGAVDPVIDIGDFAGGWPQVTTLTGGGHVVAWTEYGDSGEPEVAMYARQFDSAGQPAGEVVKVSTDPGYYEDGSTALAGLADGGWVAVWTFDRQDGVFARRFDANGAPQGEAFRIDTDHPYVTAVTVTAFGGGFIVGWTGYDPDGGLLDSYVRMYDSAAAPATPPLRANTTTAGEQSFTEHARAIAPTGTGFVAVWCETAEISMPENPGVHMQRFDAAGNPLGGEVAVTEPGAWAGRATVSNLLDGGYIVAWSQGDVYARRYDANGNALGQAFKVNTWKDCDEPQVRGLSDGGWVVLWQSRGADGDDTRDISGQRYDAAGNAVGGEFLIGATRGHDEFSPSMAIRADGNLLVTWYGRGGMHQMVIDDFAADTRPANTSSADEVVGGDGLGDYATSEVVALPDGGHLVVWSDLDGGVFTRRYDADGAPVGDAVALDSGGSGAGSASAAALAGGGWVVVWDAPDASGAGVYAQMFGADGGAVGGTFQVNQKEASSQYHSSVTALDGGGFAVAWHDNDSSADTDVLVRVYDAAGRPVGDEFPVAGAGSQATGFFNHTISGLDGGGFAVVWTGGEVHGRVFAADGTPLGEAFQVNSTTVGTQKDPSIARLADGGFIVTWSDEGRDGFYDAGRDGSEGGILLQRFDASGAPLGAETVVNTWTAGDQANPRALGLDDGGYVIVWQSFNTDGALTDQIAGQRFGVDGGRMGGEFVINVDPQKGHAYPSVALRDDGALIVTWTGGQGAVEQRIIEDFDQASGAKTLVGGAGNDSFNGSHYRDVMDGGAGDDRFFGMDGDDVLTGGLGADSFVYGSRAGDDRITDFVLGEDALVLMDGHTITATAEIDEDGDGTLDTLVTLSTGDTVLLYGVHGIAGIDELLA